MYSRKQDGLMNNENFTKITDQSEKIIGRLRRKLEDRNNKIAGLRNRIRELENQLAYRPLGDERFLEDLRRSIQYSLTNMRMIPVLGLSDSSIVEVTSTAVGHRRRAPLRSSSTINSSTE